RHRPVRAHGHLQPAVGSREDARAEIHLYVEQSVRDGHGGIRHRPGDDDAGIVVRIVDPELQVVSPVRLAAVVVKLALITERRALSLKEFDRTQQRGQQTDESSSHNSKRLNQTSGKVSMGYGCCKRKKSLPDGLTTFRKFVPLDVVTPPLAD